MRFTKRVGRTISKGRITVPRDCHEPLDNSNYCPMGVSVDVIYCLQNGPELYGRLYQSTNNTTTYYQFYIAEPRDEEIFKEHMKNLNKISLDFDLMTNRLHIAPAIE